MKGSRHGWILAGVLLLGTGLRFWNLDLKPVWMDEVLTALFSLGRSHFNLPLDHALPLTVLDSLFTLNPETTCAQIKEAVSMQSVHPPLFFCWMHSWMNWLSSLPQPWIWKLRALPALIGVVTIVALYQLNRVAFSPAAGLMGAAIMAVSPFAVYLSQEARHYTLPMLMVTLALLGLYQLQTDLYRRQFRPAIWLGWIIVNSLGFYIHYFFLVAFIAQVGTLAINILTLKSLPTLLHPTPYTPLPSYFLRPRYALGAVALAALGVCLTYIPWLPTLLNHLSRPETDWLKPKPSWVEKIAPLYQLLSGWVLMVIALPVETQPQWIAVPVGLLMLGFAGWLLRQTADGFAQRWSDPDTHLATRLLAVFVLCVLLEFLAIVYVVGKDITLVPRYNFLYFPAVCALLGASLVQPQAERRQNSKAKSRRVIATVLLVGVLSSLFVVTNHVFLKPYRPDQVAQKMRVEPELPLLMEMAYKDLQDVALGLSFALALQQQSDQDASDRYFALLSRSQSYDQFWQAATHLKTHLNQPLPFPLNLWIVGPGLKRSSYPAQLLLRHAVIQPICNLDPQQHHRLGIPYQLYRCGA